MEIFIYIVLIAHFVNLILFMGLAHKLEKKNSERWFHWTILLAITSILLITCVIGLTPIDASLPQW